MQLAPPTAIAHTENGTVCTTETLKMKEKTPLGLDQ
jgi:hypothetical protein